ncbi:MAG: response regulator [Cyanobacteria bacterium P01_D01_bin.1]
MDREKEIRLQFLDEAAEYLDTLEAALLGIAQRGIETHEINTALRAAHSIKGGAALMGYALTSDFAHRLEDSLKVLKIQRGEGVTSDIESQMLNGVDAIRQIVERNRHATEIDEDWIVSQVAPIFDSLCDTLGEPSAEDAASIMDADEGQDVMPLIFQTEVEGVLERLEALLEEQPINLQAEIVVMAQELAGLGEMLDLPPFIQLCESVETYMTGAQNTQQLEEVSKAALASWRRAQALVLTGNVDSMPNQLSGINFGTIDIDIEEDTLESIESAGLEDTSFEDTGFEDTGFEEIGFADTDLGAQNNALIDDVFAGLGEEDDALVEDVFALIDEPFLETTAETSEETVGKTSETEDTASEVDAFAGIFEEAADEQSGAEKLGQSGAAFRFSETPRAQTSEPDLADNTVRVPVRKLNELNDHFGELTIERNRLEAEVKRMRSLVKNLGRKLRSLDEINDDVKDLYEQPSSQFLLSGTSSNGSQPSSALTSPALTQTAGNRQSSAADPLGVLANPSGTPADTGFRKGFDTLEFDRYNDAHLPFRQIVESVVKLQEVADDLELSVDKTEQTTRVIYRTARHLQRNLNQLRMRPLSDVTNRFPRALRELEMEHGKSVQLQLEGENTLIDRNILEALNDPLMHIVRNAFDHGIETPETRENQGKSATGTIAIRAFNQSNRTIITVSDDGNGIALEKIRDRAQSMGLDAELLSAASKTELLSLIFEPGFSTSDQVTALSGRGVGMDVVRNNLTQIRGDISVDTHSGQGTTFTLSVPYTLSITRIMLVEANRIPIAVPTDMIEEVTILDPDDVHRTDGKEVFSFKGKFIRLIRLADWLAFNCPRQVDSLETPPSMDTPSVLIFHLGEQLIGLQIDRSWREQEVAVRRVEGPIALPTGFSNCTILENGKVVPIVSLSELARWIVNCESSGIRSAKALYSNPVVNGAIDPISLQTVPNREDRRAAKFLVIDDSINVRRLLAMTLEKAGYEVIEARDGQDALEKLETGIEIDSVVCDVEMPRMDGYSFLSKLRTSEKYENIPITMLTSRSGDKHRSLAMNLGATAYFAKPYQERALLKSLAESLEAAAAEKAATEKTATEKTAANKTAMDKAAADKAAANKAAANKAAANKAAVD